MMLCLAAAVSSRATEQLTLVAMHHPPLVTGAPMWDELGPMHAVVDGELISHVKAVR